MKRFTSLVSFILIIFISFGCDQSSPELIVPDNHLIGQPIALEATGLVPEETYSISAEKIDEFGRTWLSEASFKADRSGQIDLNRQTPVNGSYTNADIFGLLWSMTMKSLPDNWQAPEPNDFTEIRFSLTNSQDTLHKATTVQWIIPQTVENEVLQNDLEAEVFRNNNSSGKQPAILFLGGSGGGLSWARRQAAFFADQGYVTLALAYFNSGELPKHLAQLPLEYVERALEYLADREDVDSDKIGILGYSKGAELALLIASQNSKIKSVAAIAPGSAVFQGFKPPKYPVISSWTRDGKDLPFVPNAYDKKFFETFDGMYLWYRTLAQHNDFDKAAIPVEKINGDILLISGVKDKIWPATFMAEQIIARLHIAEFSHNYEHLAYPNAGHGIAEPPGKPTTRVAERLGGAALGNAQARESGWNEITDFFNRTLKESAK